MRISTDTNANMNAQMSLVTFEATKQWAARPCFFDDENSQWLRDKWNQNDFCSSFNAWRSHSAVKDLSFVLVRMRSRHNFFSSSFYHSAKMNEEKNNAEWNCNLYTFVCYTMRTNHYKYLILFNFHFFSFQSFFIAIVFYRRWATLSRHNISFWS